VPCRELVAGEGRRHGRPDRTVACIAHIERPYRKAASVWFRRSERVDAGSEKIAAAITSAVHPLIWVNDHLHLREVGPISGAPDCGACARELYSWRYSSRGPRWNRLLGLFKNRASMAALLFRTLRSPPPAAHRDARCR